MVPPQLQRDRICVEQRRKSQCRVYQELSEAIRQDLSSSVRSVILFLIFLIPQCVVSQNNDALRYKGYLFKSQPVPEEVQTRMKGCSIPVNATIGFDQLRYLTLPYYDFDEISQKS